MGAMTHEDVQISKLNADDRLLYDSGLMFLDGSLTDEGWELMKDMVLEEKKAGLVALVKSVNDSKSSPVEQTTQTDE